MARTKKELTPEEEKALKEKKELEKQKKQEEREKEIKNCVLKESQGATKTEINKFIDFCKTNEVSQHEVIRLGVEAVIEGIVPFEFQRTTTLRLKKPTTEE